VPLKPSTPIAALPGAASRRGGADDGQAAAAAAADHRDAPAVLPAAAGPGAGPGTAPATLRSPDAVGGGGVESLL
jgi:hypothetical protein